MKSIRLFLLFGLFVLPIYAIAQTKIIPNVGLVLSKTNKPILATSEVNESSTYGLLGAFAGVDLRVSESHYFAQFGLAYQMYSSNSMILEDQSISNAFAGHSKLHEVKLKIMAGFYFLPKNKFANLYINGGVHPYYIYKQSNGSDTPVLDLDELERLNVGVSFGAGIDLMNRINIEARYEISMNRYTKHNASNLNSRSIALGYMF